MIHLGNNTKSTIISKGISAGQSQNSYRGLVQVSSRAENARNFSQCDSLLMGNACGAHTFPYLEVKNKSAQIESVEDIFTIGLNRAVTLISEAKPGRISSSIIKNLGEHPDDKKPVKVMKGKFGPYIKHKSLNATIPEEKDPNEITMEEALILIEKRKEYDRNKRKKR